jgi:hypothetical protein
MSEETVVIPYHMSPANFHRLFNMSKAELFAERSRTATAYTQSNPLDEGLRLEYFDVWKMIKVKKEYGILG